MARNDEAATNQEEPVVARDDAAATNQDQSVVINALQNDTLLAGASGGLTRDPVQGTLEVVSGEFIYTPFDGFCGTDTFEYAVWDATGVHRSTANVFIQVACVSPPVTNQEVPVVAADDSASTGEGEPVLINVVANDAYPNGDILTLSSDVASSPPCESGGSIFVIGDGSEGVVEYVPPRTTTASVITDRCKYTVCNEMKLCAIGTVIVTVKTTGGAVAAAALPVAGDDFRTTRKNVPIQIQVTDNDMSPSNYVLTVTNVWSESNEGGAVSIVGDGTPGRVDYTPPLDYVGNDSFKYTVSDGNGGSTKAAVFISVEPPLEDESDELLSFSAAIVADEKESENVTGEDDGSGPPPSSALPLLVALIGAALVVAIVGGALLLAKVTRPRDHGAGASYESQETDGSDDDDGVVVFGADDSPLWPLFFRGESASKKAAGRTGPLQFRAARPLPLPRAVFVSGPAVADGEESASPPSASLLAVLSGCGGGDGQDFDWESPPSPGAISLRSASPTSHRFYSPTGYREDYDCCDTVDL